MLVVSSTLIHYTQNNSMATGINHWLSVPTTSKCVYQQAVIFSAGFARHLL